MLTLSHARHFMSCLWSQLISTGRDPYRSYLIRYEKTNRSLQQTNLNAVFSKSKTSQVFSSRYDVIHPLKYLQLHVQPLFLSVSLLWQIMIVISFPHGYESALAMAPELELPGSSTPYQTKWWNIINEKWFIWLLITLIILQYKVRSKNS